MRKKCLNFQENVHVFYARIDNFLGEGTVLFPMEFRFYKQNPECFPRIYNGTESHARIVNF